MVHTPILQRRKLRNEEGRQRAQNTAEARAGTRQGLSQAPGVWASRPQKGLQMSTLVL